MNGNGRPIGGTFEDIGETVNQTVLKPVTDEIGKALEVGIQSVAGTPIQTQQQKQQKSAEDQQKMTAWRWKLQKIKELEESQKRIREEEKQRLLQQKQEEEKQDKQQVKQFEMFKKQKEVNPEIAARGKAELKRGVGG